MSLMKTVIISIIVITLVGGASILGIKYLEKNAPEAETMRREEKDPVVKTEIVAKGDLEFPLTSEGVVRASRETVLSAQVAGRIVEMHPDFEVGATFKEGVTIARIDPVNFEAVVAQAKSALADAKLNLVQEKARAEQSERDWKKIGGGKAASELVLRKPFLESANALVVSAQAGLDRAYADLARTEIKAPFDCRVRAVNLNLGATVAPGAQLGTIYDHENLTIQLPFSLDDYAQIPERTEIKLSTTISGQTYEWEAEKMWELGEIDQATLSAYILAKVVPNPEASSRFRLPVPGVFLNASLKGAVLPGVVGVPRSAVRGRNQIYVMNGEDKLESRDLSIARKTATMVYATQGIQSGEKVIMTKLEMPVEGMSLREAGPEMTAGSVETTTPK